MVTNARLTEYGQPAESPEPSNGDGRKFIRPETGNEQIVRLQIRGGAYVYWMGTTYLAQAGLINYERARVMRRIPTIALIRDVIVGQVVNAPYHFEADDLLSDPQAAFVARQIERVIQGVRRAAAMNMIDFGWAGFETLWDTTKAKIPGLPAMQWQLTKCLPLFPDFTYILVDGRTGAWRGFRQGITVLPMRKSLLFSWRPEGTAWYGQSMLANTALPADYWTEIFRAATTFAARIAGAFLILHFPPGQSVHPATGRTDENWRIANHILDHLEANGKAAMANADASQVANSALGGDLRMAGWWFEIVESKPHTTEYTPLLQYCDIQMCRGLGWPERAIIEAVSSGSRSDSETHEWVAREKIGEMLGVIHSEESGLNWLIDRILAYNFGEQYCGSLRCHPWEEPQAPAEAAEPRTAQDGKQKPKKPSARKGDKNKPEPPARAKGQQEAAVPEAPEPEPRPHMPPIINPDHPVWGEGVARDVTNALTGQGPGGSMDYVPTAINQAGSR